MKIDTIKNHFFLLHHDAAMYRWFGWEKIYIYFTICTSRQTKASAENEGRKIWLICYFSTRSAPRGGKLISIASANLRLSANDLTTWCEVMWFHLLLALLLQQPSLIFFFYIKFDSHSLFALSCRRDDVEWKGQDHDLWQRAEENRNWRDSKTLFFLRWLWCASLSLRRWQE